MPADPMMAGMGGAAMGLGPGPMPGAQPGGPQDMALAALGDLQPKSPNPTVSMQRMEEAADLAHKLLMTMLPQVAMQKPETAKKVHAAARMVLDIKSDIRKEAAPQPPPDLMLGMAPGGPSMGAGM